jgi:Lysylphosphatidylglycerol synthase TM region
MSENSGIFSSFMHSHLGVMLARPIVKNIILILTVSIFTAGVIASIIANPTLVRDVSWAHVALLLFVGAPSLTLANAVEIQLMARAVNAKIKFIDCVHASVLSTASNILPIPGGVIVRVAALSANGVTVSAASGITAISSAIWLAIGFVAAGAALSSYNANVSAAFIAVGIFVFAGALCFALKAGVNTTRLRSITAVKVAIVAIEGLRYYWALQALNIDAGLLQAYALSAATVVGSAVAIAPAGLGVREGAAAFLAMAVSLSPAAGFLSSALNRITMYGMLAIAVLAFGVFESRKNAVLSR